MTALEQMLSDLHQTREESADYNEDNLMPTAYAVVRTERLLKEAARLVPTLTYSDPFPDGDGGIRIEWSVGPRILTLMVARQPDKREYIYFQEGEHYGCEYTVTAETLARYLDWLAKGNQAEGR